LCTAHASARSSRMSRFVPYRRSLTSRGRALRREGTPAERKLWYEFLSDQPEKFTRQKPLGNYIADFYCARRRLAIEVDGDSHFIEAAQRYDQARTRAIASLGVRVVRFTNTEVMEAFEGVCMEIRRALENC
jgi:very-short-patch-repair endonuclease